jgi:GTP cyclohydrolase II
MVRQPIASNYLKLATPPNSIRWGAADPLVRGAIVGSVTRLQQRNVIGTHGGGYSLYQALAVASGQLNPQHQPDLQQTQPVVTIPVNPTWCQPDRIVSLDPWGAVVTDVFAPLFQQGYDIRPTIAVTQAQLHLPEIVQARSAGRLTADGVILQPNGAVAVTKIAIDAVWYLPGIAKRLRISEKTLRRALYEQTGGMFAELTTRFDLKVFLPPIGGATVYVMGDIKHIADRTKPLTLRIHDECNGSDVFGSDICTCRPYLIHGIEECVKTSQGGGVGLVVYLRKEGRALGEVTKFLVYNARKRMGDRADQYFERTECVAGVKDMRFQEFMPDILHWLGVQTIDRLISMSDMKYNAIVDAGITVVDRVPIPENLIPADAWVEINAKKNAGYYTGIES